MSSKDLYYQKLQETDSFFKFNYKDELKAFLKSNEYCRFEFVNFCSNLFEKLVKKSDLKKTLYIQNSFHFLKSFPLQNINHDLYYSQYEKKLPVDGNWEIVVGVTNWSVKDKDGDRGLNTIVDSLQLISKNGIGIYFLPSVSYLKATRFNKKIKNKNFYLNSIIQLPQGSYQPSTALRGILVFISQRETEKIYIAEFEDFEPLDDQYEIVCEEIIGQHETDPITQIPSNYEILSDEELDGIDPVNEDFEEDLWHGTRVFYDSFKGFENLKAEHEINKIISDYKDYNKYSLSDLGTINKCKYDEEYKNSENSIYIPVAGNKIYNNIEQLNTNHSQVFQIILNEEKILANYLISFLKSSLGIKLVNSQKTGSIIATLSKKEIQDLIVPVPPLNEQEKIIATFNKMNIAIEEFEKLRENISINPISSKEDLEKLDAIIMNISELSDADDIKRLIRNGESKILEFKETFGLNVKTNETKVKYLELEVIKTIAAFLNTGGGNLLIGIHDSGEIRGLNNELEKSFWSTEIKNFMSKEQKYTIAKDNFLKHFKNKMKTAIGEKNYLFYDSKFIEIDGKLIFRIQCKKAIDPVFVYDKDFYVRTDPATDKLEGSEQANFIKNRFYSN